MFSFLNPTMLINMSVASLNMRKVNTGSRGNQWTLAERLGDIDFAVDLCLITQRARNMQESLLVRYARQVELQIKVIKPTPCALSIAEKIAEEKESFCYLEIILAENEGADFDVRCSMPYP